MESHRARSKWRTLAGILAVIVTFVTTYSLILPAITVSVEQVEEVEGLYLGEDDDGYEIVEDNDEQYEQITPGEMTRRVRAMVQKLLGMKNSSWMRIN